MLGVGGVIFNPVACETVLEFVVKGVTAMPDPPDYVVRQDASIADVDLDREELFFQGERLTEECADQIAATALADARRRSLIPGR